jgi:hypothetical protein
VTRSYSRALAGSVSAIVSYSGVAGLTLNGGAGGNVFDVQSTVAPTTINGQRRDTVNVGAGGSVQQIVGPLSVDTASTMIVDDSATTTPETYTVSASTIVRSGAAPISYRVTNQLELRLGSGGNLVNIQSTFPGLPVVFVGGVGSDKFNIRTPPPASVTVTLDGGMGSNTLQAPNQSNVWQVTGANAGSLDKNVNFTHVQNLVGGTGNDAISFRNGGSLAGTINGGGGVDTLDYSSYTGNVIVDLPLHLASLANHLAANSVFNIEHVTGSKGNNLLVGDANANVLVGGTGRNVLIGGKGADALDAHLSVDDNILIGGTTDWDMNLAALEAIMAEWDRTDLNFNDRRSDLLNGTNGQGKPPLNIVNGRLILLTPATNPASNNGTVHADGASDTLTGTNAVNPATGKRAHNWFFYDALDVLINYLSSSDRKNPVR